MDVKEILEQFNVSESESKLKTLICCPEPIPATKSLSWILPEQISNLNFEDQSFHLALCYNVLFVDSQLSEAFHLKALEELSRVATEVRVFPLLDIKGSLPVHLGPVLKVLQDKGYGVELKETRSKAMLRLWNPSCAIVASSEKKMS